MAERMTISQLAAAAQVSVPTVSKVLNGRPDVASGTRARVEAAIQRHGYQRRRAATPRGPRLIDLVFNELGNPWALEVIRGVEGAAREQGVEVVLSECSGARTPRQEWLDSVLERRPTGVIMVFSDLDLDQRTQLEARSIPFVVVDPVGEEQSDVPSVGSANFSGGQQATRHLLDLGHRRVAVIGGPPETLASRARVGGYRDALARYGVPVDEALVRHGNFFVEDGHDEALSLLTGPNPPTAIFAGNDLQALGVYRAARELGLHVPDDLSVVGYDDLPVARWVGPELTTVHQPLTRMAAAATGLLLTLAAGEEPPALRMDLAVDLVVRGSTAPPRPRAG
ncbi:LacI family DNA-binding transcriptional regulator [Kineococcus aurantiacus]|uniref:LacI family xylobiose transport system transcriptional regulator n=2 Tax=Kineococcus aurantiacus TaxID=37633 RepID=A0A7Y9DMK9_9ACTN|nr:LacI family DNA-binding transcriptional regulator [Kineococcus aurantiacus]NYD23251.1 LacI family xylobiose transport system transcriptional regulator [Kineococcus aurantiacus]